MRGNWLLYMRGNSAWVGNNVSFVYFLTTKMSCFEGMKGNGVHKYQ